MNWLKQFTGERLKGLSELNGVLVHEQIERLGLATRPCSATGVSGSSRGSTQLTLWWIAAGSLPSVEDAKRKLELLEANGPTPAAFTFKDRFPPPG